MVFIYGQAQTGTVGLNGFLFSDGLQPGLALADLYGTGSIPLMGGRVGRRG